VLLGKRTKAAIQAVVLAVLTGLLAWHTIYWHMNGTHQALFEAIGDTWWDTAKGVLYNLGLMAATGLLLGLFMERFTDLVGYQVKKIEHFENETASDSSDAWDERAAESDKQDEARVAELVS
jgi:hypothetical protein